MQMMVSSEIEKRIDDTSSTASRRVRERTGTTTPEVDTDMRRIMVGSTCNSGCESAKGRLRAGPLPSVQVRFNGVSTVAGQRRPAT
jgi:hypothetical protein